MFAVFALQYLNKNEPTKQTPVLDLLSDPERWTKHVLAEVKDGASISPTEYGAFRFCMRGAVESVHSDPHARQVVMGKILESIHKIYGNSWRNVPSFNDAKCRKHAQVVQVLRDAGV